MFTCQKHGTAFACWFCHIIYVWFEWRILSKLWFCNPFSLTARASWVKFGSGFSYEWILVTGCILKTLKGYEKSDVGSHCTLQCLHVLFCVTVSYRVKCLELIEFHFVLHNLGNPFTSVQTCVFLAFPILQRFPSLLPFLLIMVRM